MRWNKGRKLKGRKISQSWNFKNTAGKCNKKHVTKYKKRVQQMNIRLMLLLWFIITENIPLDIFGIWHRVSQGDHWTTPIIEDPRMVSLIYIPIDGVGKFPPLFCTSNIVFHQFHPIESCYFHHLSIPPLPKGLPPDYSRHHCAPRQKKKKYWSIPSIHHHQ